MMRKPAIASFAPHCMEREPSQHPDIPFTPDGSVRRRTDREGGRLSYRIVLSYHCSPCRRRSTINGSDPVFETNLSSADPVTPDVRIPSLILILARLQNGPSQTSNEAEVFCPPSSWVTVLPERILLTHKAQMSLL